MARDGSPHEAGAPIGEPVAIIGMSCRFPGEANDPDSFWRNLAEGIDSLTPVPADRWDSDRFYAASARTLGKTQMRQGGFIAGVELFDAAFFGISPREAAHMDPQHRLALQLVWSALEDANILPASLRGSDTGIFLGLGSSDYFHRFVQGPVESLDSFSGVGNSPGVAAGRVAHILGLQGPCMVIDTTCSSSLVNLHAACGALRLGECDLAVAGGVHLMFSPRLPIIGSQASMLSPTDRSHTFDAQADGFARGEGGGMVVLKLLSRAVADGDLIHGLALGSAINHDGASFGLTVPSGPAQQRVIEKAYRAAGVTIDDLGYIEAHGTGTPLGDPIEVNALARVFRDRTPGRPLYIGSVKTNIGHLEAAAGAAGLIKTVLSLRAGLVAPTAGLETPTPKVKWAQTQVTPVRSLTEWPFDGRRVAGVSAFGFSGTNVHVVLSEPPKAPAPAVEHHSRLLLPLSARTAGGLAAQAKAFAERLETASVPEAARLCRTATHGRTRFTHRVAAVGRTPAELRDRLQTLGRRQASSVPLVRQDGEAPRVGFVFAGQGGAYPGMGRGLLDERAFRDELTRLSELVEPFLEVSLVDLVRAADPLILDNRFVQPAMYAIAQAASCLWASYGVRPHAVLGHSLGEIAAAAAAGMITSESAMRFVARRARAIADDCEPGAMVEVICSDPTQLERLAERHDLALAAFNADDRAVLAGKVGAVEALQADCSRAGLTTFRLNVSRAFHSPLCDPALAAIEAAASELEVGERGAIFVSSLRSDVVHDPADLDAAYWRDQVRRPVRFDGGLRTLKDLGCEVLIDIGPHPALRGAVAAVLGEGAPYVATLRRGSDDADSFATARATLFARGAEVFADDDLPRAVLDLGRAPTYAFEPRRHWHDWVDAGQTPLHRLGPDLLRFCWEAAPGVEMRPPGTIEIFAPSDAIARGWAERLRDAGLTVRQLAQITDLSVEPGDARRTLLLPLADVRTLEDARSAEEGVALAIWLAGVARDLQGRGQTFAGDLDCVLLTRGAVCAAPAGEPVNPAHAAAWGAARCVRAEGRVTGLRLVDFAIGDVDADGVDLLVRELTNVGPEVALRGERMTPSLIACTRSAERRPALAGGAFLVTGATGALGEQVIDWLLRQGAGRLALNARSLPALEAIAGRVRSEGADCVVVAGDLGDGDTCRQIVAEAKRAGCLTGVFHCAGAIADVSVLDLDRDHLEDTFAAKARGAEALLDATADCDLDYFVGFSSLAAVLGSPGQSAYAAANGFLDGLLLDRRHRGRSTQTINWGPWAERGMAARLDEAAKSRFERSGVGLMAADDAIACLRKALALGVGQVLAAQVDWPLYARTALSARALGVRIETIDPTGDNLDVARSSVLAENLRTCEAEALVEATGAYFDAVVREISLLGGEEELPSTAYLGEIGFDSLMLLTLKARLEADLDLAVPLSMLGGQTSIEGVVDHLVDDLRLSRIAAARPEAEELAVL